MSKRLGRAIVSGYKSLRAWMRGAPQMTEEERRKQAIEMMRLAMYGQAGGPGKTRKLKLRMKRSTWSNGENQYYESIL